MLCVAGGKYTTYRHMAEVITDEAARRLGAGRRCRTHALPLDGTPEEPWGAYCVTEPEALAARGLELSVAEHLVSRYGRRARNVAEVLSRDSQLSRRVVEGEPDVVGEFTYQREQEMALTPADHLLRRTRLALFRPGLLEKSSRLCS
jgi:glycerol-3-phosphate dehydrogenase